MPHPRRAQEGFGIVVVALLFTAFAVIAAAALDRSSIKIELDRQKQVAAQLTRLSIAMAKFARYTDHRLPCPASWLLDPTNGNFGVGVVISGTPTIPCATGTVTPATDGVVLAGGSSNKLLIGMVPVKDLVAYGVSYNDAFDPWGARIIYAVHRNLTTGTSNADVAAASNTERALVTDFVTNEPIVPGPDAVVVSFGRDRVGGRLRNQADLTNPSINCGSSVDRRLENCDNDNIFVRGPLFISPRAPTGEYFDDSISTIRYTP